jgi:multicomponent Na+:H+ antiporter subunit F
VTFIDVALLVALGGVLVRLLLGPTPWDRLLAYNSASNRVVALLATGAIASARPFLLDVAIVYVALSFLGTVILARFMERGGTNR